MISIGEINVKFLVDTAYDHRVMLIDPFTLSYQIEGADKRTFTVPAGFITDLGSSPRALWNIVAPWDIACAAIVHDYLYTKQGYTEYRLSRKEADTVMYDIIRLTKGKWMAFVCLRAVRAFGKKYFAVR